MYLPLGLLLVSGVACVAAVMLPGWSDGLLMAGPSALAGLILLARAVVRRRSRTWILIDGSNVLYWKDGTPQIDAVREVVQHLAGAGFAPGVMFDANAGYLLAGRYQHHGAMAEMVGLPEDRVLVVPKGTPADAYLLAAARDLGARIVTNDRYRDWAEAHPEVAAPGHLVRGGFRDGGLWLDLDTPGAGQPAVSGVRAMRR